MSQSTKFNEFDDGLYIQFCSK